MAIHNQKTTEGDSGWKKGFQAGSEEILLDLVQSQQYKYPVPSAIRELVTNCTDSIREKNQYFEILAGRAKPEDFYIHREGPMYEDSNYNPGYYTEKWLSKSENRVTLIYKERGNTQRDTLHIIDTGVGLGGKRLEKSFNPLFSTKRNTATQTGKFGLGSKAGLSLETDYYTLISRYNGAEFQFQVYDYKVDPIIPRMNTTKGVVNPYYEAETLTELVDGVERPKRIYYLETDKPNGVEVILQAKKGLKKEFVDGIKSQLLYLDGIDFFIEDVDGNHTEETVKAVIEYEDDIFVMPTQDSTYYAKPHIILNNICYGYVDFLQMELEDKAGNIGMKINPSLIDINPNRESVRWTEKTREVILDTFRQGEKIAERVLTEALTSEDLIDWAIKCSTAIDSTDRNSVVGRFSQIADLKHVAPHFTLMPQIKYASDPRNFFLGYEIWETVSEQKWSKTKQSYSAGLNRFKLIRWSSIRNKPIFYQDKDTTFRQEMFMLTIYPQGFVKIIPKGSVDFKSGELSKDQLELVSDIDFTAYQKLTQDEKDKRVEAKKLMWENERELLDTLIKDSAKVELYSSIQVPEGYKTTEKEAEEEAEEAEEEVTSKLTAAEQRALENRIVATAFRAAWEASIWYRDKKQPKIKEILSDRGDIIYGFAEDEANLVLVAEILGMGKENLRSDGTWLDNQKVVMIAQNNAKYFKPHIYIQDFFTNVNPETDTITMHNQLVKWQTARKINDALPKLKFLQNFGIFDPQAKAMYLELVGYVDLNYVDLKAGLHNHKSGKNAAQEVIDSLSTHADKITELQLFVKSHPGNYQAIAAMSKALFDTDEDGSFKDALGIEIDIYEKLLTLLEFTKQVQVLLNSIGNLSVTSGITYELEREIKEYLAYKEYVSVTQPTAAEASLQPEIAETIEAV